MQAARMSTLLSEEADVADEENRAAGRITVYLQAPAPDGSGLVRSEVVLSTATLGAVELPRLLRRLQDRASAGAHGRLDADEIVRGLWQGSSPPAGPALARLGFTLVVFCAQEIQPPASAYPGVRVLHAPNDDTPELPEENERIARMAAAEVADTVARGGKALVVCAAGLNRSGLVVALALRELMPTVPVVRLVERVRRHRPLALSNEFFVRWLSVLPPPEPPGDEPLAPFP